LAAERAEVDDLAVRPDDRVRRPLASRNAAADHFAAPVDRGDVGIAAPSERRERDDLALLPEQRMERAAAVVAPPGGLAEVVDRDRVAVPVPEGIRTEADH